MKEETEKLVNELNEDFGVINTSHLTKKQRKKIASDRRKYRSWNTVSFDLVKNEYDECGNITDTYIGKKVHIKWKYRKYDKPRSLRSRLNVVDLPTRIYKGHKDVCLDDLEKMFEID